MECENMLRVMLVIGEVKKLKVGRLVEMSRKPEVMQGVAVYPLYDWGTIWHDFQKLRLMPRVRELVYRFVMGILASKQALCVMGLVKEAKCEHCEESETAFHAVYFCRELGQVRVWLARVFKLMGGGNVEILRALTLEVRGVSEVVKRAILYIVTDFLFYSWGLKEKGGGIRVRAIAAGIYRTVCRNKLIYGNRWTTAFPEAYRNITVRGLSNLAT